MATANFNGFLCCRPDGSYFNVTLQRRTFNRRPFAVYFDGSQSPSFNTYINRGSCERAIRKYVEELKRNRPDIHIIELRGEELVRS